MTSKEALEELYKEREYLLGEKVNNKTKNWHNDITHYDNINHCLLTIKQDLDRLEKLEKTIELLKVRVKMLETYHKPKSRCYYLYIGGRIVFLSREEYDLLKEVLEDE